MARKKRVHASPMRPEIQGLYGVAGLYGRLSVLDNGKVDGEPIESQIAIIEQYVAGHPELKIVERYIDNGYTGTNFDRPNWERMMADVKSGRINCIIVKDLSAWAATILRRAVFWNGFVQSWVSASSR